MKKYIYLLLCILLVTLVITIPELHPQACNLDGDTLTMLAAGPAFAPLKWKTGQNNMAGYKGRLLFVPFDAPNSVPTVPDPEKATGNTELITAAGSFGFPAEGTIKQPIYLYSTDATVEYKADPQGEADGISYKCTLGFFFPGNTPGMHAFNALVKNTPGYYIFEDADGKQMMLGQPGLYATTSPAFNGGKAKADRRGTTYTATADSNYSAIFLETPIDMEVIAGLKPTSPSQGGNDGESPDPTL